MRLLVLTLFLLTILSLWILINDQNTLNINGAYYSIHSKWVKAQWYIKGKRKFVQGNYLNLQADSTFDFSTCNCTSNGEWHSRNDTLFLLHKTTTLVINTDGCYQPKHYLIDGSLLIGNNQGESIELLKRQK